MKKRVRNYAEEYERKKELNKVYCIALDKGISKEFDEKLKVENKTVSKWFRENVSNYVKKT